MLVLVLVLVLLLVLLVRLRPLLLVLGLPPLLLLLLLWCRKPAAVAFAATRVSPCCPGLTPALRAACPGIRVHVRVTVLTCKAVRLVQQTGGWGIAAGIGRLQTAGKAVMRSVGTNTPRHRSGGGVGRSAQSGCGPATTTAATTNSTSTTTTPSSRGACTIAAVSMLLLLLLLLLLLHGAQVLHHVVVPQTLLQEVQHRGVVAGCTDHVHHHLLLLLWLLLALHTVQAVQFQLLANSRTPNTISTSTDTDTTPPTVHAVGIHEAQTAHQGTRSRRQRETCLVELTLLALQTWQWHRVATFPLHRKVTTSSVEREVQHCFCTVVFSGGGIVRFRGVHRVKENAEMMLFPVVANLARPFLMPLVPRDTTKF